MKDEAAVALILHPYLVVTLPGIQTWYHVANAKRRCDVEIPFPGMDPYLEDPTIWPDVHNRLFVTIR